MKKVIEYFADHSVITNWIILVVFLAGAFGLLNLKMRIWPKMELDSISINFPYPGASAVEVEEGIIAKAEERLRGMDGIDSIYSTSMDGHGNIYLRINPDFSINRALEKVRTSVNSISSYPSAAEKPHVSRNTRWNRALLLTVSGQDDLYSLKKIVEEFRDELLKSKEISLVNLSGLPQRVISIEISPEKLSRYKLTLNVIAQAIKSTNLNVSSGSILTNRETILIRSYGKKYGARELESIPIVSKIDGQSVLLGDICTIREQWPENILFAKVGGKRIALIHVMYNNNEDVIEIVKVVEAKAKEYEKKYGGLVRFETFIRDVDELEHRLGTLTQNGLIGLVLVIMVLGFFLNIKLSFWVALGIPISFMGMFFIQSLLEITINEMSLFGMIMVIGILVDDGIIIGESIYSQWEREGKSSLQAAVDGTLQVIKPVTISILTTIVAFVPYFYIYRELGKYVWQIAAIIIICLLISLVEAAIILPVHLSHSSAIRKQGQAGQKPNIVRRFNIAIINFLLNRIYKPLLKFSLNYRWSVLAAMTAMILTTVGAFQGMHVKAQFFPEIEAPYARIMVEIPAGTSAAVADRIRNSMIERAMMFGATKADPSQNIDNAIVNEVSWLDKNTINVFLILVKNEKRTYTVNQFSEELGEYIGTIPEAENINVKGSGSFGYPISLRFMSRDYDQLHKAKRLFKAALHKIDGVKDIQDDMPLGNKEIVVVLKPKAKALGLTLLNVTSQLRQGFYGQEIMSIQRGKDELKLWLRFPLEYRTRLDQIENLRIMTPTGEHVPFKEIAAYKMKRGLKRIRHKNGYRSINVYANLDYSKNNLSIVLKELNGTVIPRILSQVEGVTRGFDGQSEEVKKMTDSLKFTMTIALFTMFTILMFLLKSYAQTLLIMLMIPLGFIGAVIGHYVMGIPVSFISFLGVIALGGIIVNDSVVLVDRYNTLAKDNPAFDAIYQAGTQRFRPIVMTTITTAAGLAPLIFDKSSGGQMLVPMAVSVVFGLLFGTFLTLFMLPSALYAFSDVKSLFKMPVFSADGRQGPKNVDTPTD